MDYLIKKMNDCQRFIDEAARKGDVNMVLFWGNAALGFARRIKKELIKAYTEETV